MYSASDPCRADQMDLAGEDNPYFTGGGGGYADDEDSGEDDYMPQNKIKALAERGVSSMLSVCVFVWHFGFFLLQPSLSIFLTLT